MTIDPDLGETRAFQRAVAIFIGLCGLFAAWITFSFGGHHATIWFDDAATAVGAVTAAVLSFRAASRRPQHRSFFILLGIALACWSSGELIWGFYEVVLNVEVPFPSIADIGYLLAIPFAVAAMAVYPTAEQSRATTRVRSVLDALIIATSVLFVSWAFVLAPALHQGGASGFETFVSLAYPVGDVVIASVAIMAIHRGGVLGRLPLLLVAIGMLANAASDSVYAYLTQVGKYSSGDIIDLGWFAAYLLIALAAVVPARTAIEVRASTRSVGDLVVPYIALGCAVLVAAEKIITRQFDDQMLLWLMLSGIVLVAIRQVIALADGAAALAEAKEASRLKTAFIANMSHEIRTPMNGVMGMLALLLDRDLGEVERDYAETMAGSAEALMAVINDVLDFSKLEAGKVQPERVSFPLGATVEVAMAGIAAKAYAKNIELISIIQPDVPDHVLGDRLRVRQILANLLDNAVKFTEAGEVVVRVSNDDLGRVRFDVTDQGIGVSPENRDLLFDSFTQADMSTTRLFGGTGLGLAICKQLAELMGGEIGVDGELGVGSTFWFALPFDVVPDVDGARNSLGDARVLVVSASRAGVEGLTAQIRRETPNVVGLTDATHTLAALFDAADEGTPFDIVVIDDRIVGDSQLHLARTIAASPALSATRVVALAAQTAMVASEPQVHAWVSKPVRNTALVERLVSVRGAAQLSTAAAATPPKRQQPRHGTILVVEDNAVNAKVAVALLDSMGFEADVARDGVEALEALERCSYDAVFMDVQMPRLNGYDATREIRRRGDADTPIIAMTASAMESDRIECLEAGMDDYLSKPIDRAALTEVLGTRVRNRLPTL